MGSSSRTVELPSTFDPLGYSAAVELVLQNPGTRNRLRQRIDEDSSRDPVDALADAELLVELAKLRLREMLQRTLVTSH